MKRFTLLLFNLRYGVRQPKIVSCLFLSSSLPISFFSKDVKYFSPLLNQNSYMCSMPSSLTLEILDHQDDVCSEIVISSLKSNESFIKLSEKEGQLIINRDVEDEKKLSEGIKISIKKKIIPVMEVVPMTKKINVFGLSAVEVAQSIVSHLKKKEGNIIVLQGLSGTGKGTTVKKLQSILPKCVTWSNGNVFRCYTMLATEVLATQGKSITTETLIENPAAIEQAVQRVSFKEVASSQYDIIVDDRTLVSEIQNTTLKTPAINMAVPIVAQLTQGEVILFGKQAVKKLSDAGYNIILEGRAQTLNYIDTPDRFELVLPETSLLGQRRAAQRVMAKALELIRNHKTLSPTEALIEALQKLD